MRIKNFGGLLLMSFAVIGIVVIVSPQARSVFHVRENTVPSFSQLIFPLVAFFGFAVIGFLLYKNKI